MFQFGPALLEAGQVDGMLRWVRLGRLTPPFYGDQSLLATRSSSTPRTIWVKWRRSDHSLATKKPVVRSDRATLLGRKFETIARITRVYVWGFSCLFSCSLHRVRWAKPAWVSARSTVVKTCSVIRCGISSESSFDDAAKNAINEASKSIQNIQSLYIKEMNAKVENNQIVSFGIIAKVSFEVDNGKWWS